MNKKGGFILAFSLIFCFWGGGKDFAPLLNTPPTWGALFFAIKKVFTPPQQKNLKKKKTLGGYGFFQEKKIRGHSFFSSLKGGIFFWEKKKNALIGFGSFFYD